MSIKKGDEVKIKHQWQDTGDDQIQFVAMEDEDGGRVLIGALGVLEAFIPTQVVSVLVLEG